jgi:hypothetical protein
VTEYDDYDDDADVDLDEDDDDEITERPTKFVRRPTHLDANNAISDVPMESDLNSNDTVNELLTYVLKIQEDMLAMEAYQSLSHVTVLQRMHYYE